MHFLINLLQKIITFSEVNLVEIFPKIASSVIPLRCNSHFQMRQTGYTLFSWKCQGSQKGNISKGVVLKKMEIPKGRRVDQFGNSKGKGEG